MATTLTVACGGFDSHVPVVGPPDDVQALVGHWDGEFSSAATHRRGLIEFELEAAQDTAHAVIYYMPDRLGAMASDHPRDGSYDPSPVVLRLQRLEVQGARVRGLLETYPDPATGELVSAVFTGELQGDEIDGTYIMEFVRSGDRASGRWTVTRTSR
ncbi:MAG: hypothetical protein HKN71_12495 [Gemmatimonadetes bacterium]|nr:hypothetical protein [Gemmatimonadota bacterium]